MGHKVSVKKIDWDGIADELESIEKPQNSKPKRLYTIGAAFVAILLLFTSINIMISATTPSSAPPTVINWDELQAYKINGIRYANPLDSDSIQDALDDMTNGGLLIIPKGDYTPVVQINIPYDNIAVVGTGFSSHITFPPSVGGGLSISANHVLVRDIYVQGPGSSTSAPPYHAIVGTSVNNVTVEDCYASDFPDDQIIFHGPDLEWITVRGCHVWNCEEGIEVKGGQHILVDGNFITAGTGGAIEVSDRSVGNFDNDVNDVIVTNNVIQGGSSCGVFIYGNVTRLIISNNLIDASASGILSMASGAIDGLTNHILISNNIINNSLNYGIQFYEPIQYATISNNQILQSGTAGILMNADNKFINIIGNQISDSAYGIRWLAGVWHDALITGNSIYRMTDYGIHISVGGQNMTITNNHIQDVDSGIRGSAAITKISIRGNTVLDATTVGIQLYGTSSNVTITDNTIDSTIDCIKIWGDFGLIEGNCFSFASDAGIWIVSGSYNIIVGNRFCDCSYSVYSDGSSDYNTIATNLLYHSPLSLAGSHNYLQNNTAV